MSDSRKNPKNDLADTAAAVQREKIFSIFVCVLLFAFGIYHSFNYWRHQPVPHFDFNCFASLGRQILSLHLPTDYKRVPLVGILQVLLGKVFGGDCPEFTGGLMLNAILHPFNAVLIFLIAKRFVGKFASLLAVAAIINPQVIQLLTEAIVETTLMFFILLSFYLILRRSKWAYLTASAASMVRYEGVVLIAAAFIIDMLEGQNAKQRIKAFVYAVLASVPMFIWAVLTVINWKSQGSTYYLKEMGSQSGGKIILWDFIKLTWQIVYMPLTMPSLKAQQSTFNMVFGLNQFIAASTFILGLVFAVVKKNWDLLAMVFFLFIYILIHAIHSFMVLRFCMPIVPIPLIVSAYGLLNLLAMLKNKISIPAFVSIVFQVLIIFAALFWATAVAGDVAGFSSHSVKSARLPYIAAAICGLMCAGLIYVKGKRAVMTAITGFMLICLMIFSNQAVILSDVGNGERDIEFKYLLDWYLQNIPGEKMVLTVPVILQTMAPKYSECFIHTNTFDANSPEDFVAECYKKGITYAAWDSRMGLTPANRYYKSWKMANIAPLAVGRDIGPYQFITQFRVDQRRYVNLYRLRPLSQVQQK
jgi:hypothetical protein